MPTDRQYTPDEIREQVEEAWREHEARRITPFRVQLDEAMRIVQTATDQPQAA